MHRIPASHTSDVFEILIFKKGNGTVWVDHQEVEVEDNSILFFSPYQVKKWDTDFSKLDFTIIIFQEEFLNEFFADKLFTYRLLYFYQHEYITKLKLTDKGIQSICNISQEMKEELVQPNTDSGHIIRSLIYYLLQRLNREYALQRGLPFHNTTNNHAYAFKKLMEQHIRKKQRINDYCEMLGVSRITLNKAAKKQFKQTATELLKQRLVTEIKNDLIYSGKSVSEIAYSFGYSEPNHLMRFFKTQTGETTTEFIDAYQNGST